MQNLTNFLIILELNSPAPLRGLPQSHSDDIFVALDVNRGICIFRMRQNKKAVSEDSFFFVKFYRAQELAEIVLVMLNISCLL